MNAVRKHQAFLATDDDTFEAAHSPPPRTLSVIRGAIHQIDAEAAYM